jgi:hypothetical protein
MDDLDRLSSSERARVEARERKTRPARMVVDNAGLKKLAIHLGEKRKAASERRRRTQPGSGPS